MCHADPTIKYFIPPDRKGKQYNGGRSYEEMEAFARSKLGPGCNIKKQGLPCYTGMRLQPNHLVCGAVLPFWAEIEKGLAIRQRMKICRVRVDEELLPRQRELDC